MRKGAPRRPLGRWHRCARGAGLAVCLWLAGTGAASADPDIDVKLGTPAAAFDRSYQHLSAAEFSHPTARYPHGVLGDTIEYGTLVLHYRPETAIYTITLPEHRVFEDLTPRLIDVDNTGKPKAVVVESDADLGARLAIYDGSGLVAATPFIGTRNRWLAPLGAADLDGDGYVELAYIDRPHLAKTLRIWRYRNGTLEPVADKAGLTNHRIGEDFISGGIRHCGGTPEIVTADARWSRVMVATLSDGNIRTRDIGPFTGPESLTRALACK